MNAKSNLTPNALDGASRIVCEQSSELIREKDLKHEHEHKWNDKSQ
jgi:hypothetical protein